MRRDNRYVNRKVRDSRRTVPIFGTGDDEGVYYRCHWCGFIISIKQHPEAFSDMNAKHGVSLTYDVNSPDTLDAPVPNSNAKLLVEPVNATFILPEVDVTGEMTPNYYYYTRTVTGCPLCGTRSNRT